ncbi:ABC transporter substrate-binding protein [Clostridium butyricum]|uniref:ABC transporter substrate-binding protein n=1 Tax=Clostridium butyricum TaxID=1492 RepID=UPI00071BFD23|nr:ABC transporter substrate-binding protein [Clostridium butyricum]ALP91417.1 aliphatic sulfonate ABC transporter substrate-binding protein [Clostridium butyricum]ALS17913.1 aliphatic sulfonate ABC transporter substrate-binding protein [Clostridium butyricum]ANF15038.1 aliphatic sulfonate ABC transporter substrate-binding protein [Clostridium butyricum]AOR95047.1 aliphatic sulfonate ABC transporter substrate-binding protein [Clostridium butyricum]MDM8129891.1 ABC transporter substrate-binding
MKKRILSILCAATMMLTLCACGNSGNESGSSEGKKLTKVTLGMTTWPTNELYHLAKEKGIFEQNGLDVNIQEFSSTTDSLSAFAGGKIDFCTAPSSETIAPYGEGGDFSVVLISDKSNGCEGLIAKSDIKKVEDLKGKTIATQLYSVDHMFLLTLLDDAGMSDKDVNIVDMSIQNSGNAFIAGQCDAACVWDPYFSNAKNAGGTVLYSSEDNPNLITDTLVASSDMVNNNETAVNAIVKSFFEARKYWIDNPDDANTIMASKMGVDKEEFANEMKGLIIPDIEEELNLFKPADDYTYWAFTQNKIQKFMKDLGAINNEINCEKMLNDKFVKNYAESK